MYNEEIMVEEFSVETFCLIENYLWFVPKNINILCRTDMKTGKTERILYFDKEHYVINLFTKMYHIDKRIWFIPCNAFSIYYYNLEECRLQRMELPKDLQNKGYKFSSAYFDGKNIWAFPMQRFEGIKIDVDKEEVTELKNLIHDKGEYERSLVYSKITGNEDYIYGIYLERFLMKYNCDTQQIIFKELPKIKGGYYIIAMYHELICAFGMENGIVTICDNKLQVLDTIMLLPEDIECTGTHIMQRGDIMYIGYWPNILVEWNYSENWSVIHRYDELVRMPNRHVWGEIGLGMPFEYDTNIFLLPGDYAGIKKLNSNMEIMEIMPLKLEIEMKEMLKKYDCIEEAGTQNYIAQGRCSFDIFLEYITQLDSDKIIDNVENESFDLGRKILSVNMKSRK